MGSLLAVVWCSVDFPEACILWLFLLKDVPRWFVCLGLFTNLAETRLSQDGVCLGIVSACAKLNGHRCSVKY